jgi:hypothetical protein
MQVRSFIEAHVEVDAVRPPVNVPFGAQITVTPRRKSESQPPTLLHNRERLGYSGLWAENEAANPNPLSTAQAMNMDR